MKFWSFCHFTVMMFISALVLVSPVLADQPPIPTSLQKCGLVQCLETGASINVSALVSHYGGKVDNQGYAFWSTNIKEDPVFSFYPNNDISRIIGLENSTMQVLLVASPSGKLCAGTLGGSAGEQLAVLTTWLNWGSPRTDGGLTNYQTFDDSLLPQSVYGTPKNAIIVLEDQTTYLMYLIGGIYKVAFNNNWLSGGPQNFYELYNRPFYTYNQLGAPITVLFSCIRHEQFDYSWYPELKRPIDEAENALWSPIANQPDQDASLSRQFDLIYSSTPKASAVMILASTDNGMWSRTTIEGVNVSHNFSEQGSHHWYKWFISCDVSENTCKVENKNANLAVLYKLNLYPTHVTMEGQTTWSIFSPMFKMAILGGSVSTSNHKENPSPGDDNNPAPMIWTIPVYEHTEYEHKECDSGKTGAISPTLDIYMPSLIYQSLTGPLDIWAEFEFYGQGENGELLWKLKDFGFNQ